MEKISLKAWIIKNLKKYEFDIQTVRALYNEAMKETGSSSSEESFYSMIRKYKTEAMVEEASKIEEEELDFSGLDRDLLIEILEEEISEKKEKLQISDLKRIADEREFPVEAFSYFITDLPSVLKNIYSLNLLNTKHDVTEVTLKEQIKLLTKENKYLKSEASKLELFLSHVDPIVESFIREHKPFIRTSHSSSKRVVQLLLSDAHIGEVVSELDGLDITYDFETAKRRMVKYFSEALDYAETVKADEIQINILGDMISGNIHEELLATNEIDIVDSVLYGADFLSSLIYDLSKQIKVEKIIAMPGNHSRFDKKMPAKGHNKLSHERYLFHFMEKELNDIIPNFIIPDSVYHLDHCLGTTTIFCHGDYFKGNTSNLSTASTTWARDFTKLKGLFADAGKQANILCMGHVHSENMIKTFDGSVVITNASIIGPNEFSFGVLKVGERPSQTLFTLDESCPKHPRFLQTVYL